MATRTKFFITSMTTPWIVQRSPFSLRLSAGKEYAWRACGRSAKQPLCDGSHKGTGGHPIVITAQKSETVYFCGCKQTRTAPFCDGAHSGP